jgi:lysophospholipase L1-like esterase
VAPARPPRRSSALNPHACHPVGVAPGDAARADEYSRLVHINPNLSRQVALVLSPLLLLQARTVRRIIPMLPDSAQPWTGSLDAPDPDGSLDATHPDGSLDATHPVRLLVLGDSTAAGVGASTQDEALPGNIARQLKKHWDRGSTWNAIGENGATAADIVERFLPSATVAEYDLIFLSIGANDALQIRSRGAFRRDVRTILRRLRARNPHAFVLVSSLPAFFRFESLPNPLRWVLYLHSSSLEAAARRVVAGEPGVMMSPPPPPYTAGFFATDRFHPSASGYHDWAEFALADSGLIPATGTTSTGATAEGATPSGPTPSGPASSGPASSGPASSGPASPGPALETVAGATSRTSAQPSAGVTASATQGQGATATTTSSASA